MKAITLHSILPVRVQPSEASEQETQLLFGELVDILDEKPHWVKIKAEADGSEGWADRKMLIDLNEADYRQACDAYKGTPVRVKVPVAYALSVGNGQTMPLAAGTRLPNYQDGSFEILGAKLSIDPQAVSAPIEFSETSFLAISRLFLNSPYLWGGKNAFGYDCSGFTQVLFSLFGIDLPRNASEQVKAGEAVDFLMEARLGDLAFFNHDGGSPISHVGILLDDKRILHCSGRVKTDLIDQNGIIDSETRQYTHSLRAIKRFFN